MNLLHLADWLRTGNIAPLKWGDSLADIVAVWPEAQQEAVEAMEFGSPYLPLGNYLELYFETDDYRGLQEILVKVRNIKRGAPAEFLAPDGLRRHLTFTQVKAKLTKLGVDFKVEFGPYYGTPNIVGPGGSLLAFYTDFDTIETAEIMNLYFSREPIRVR